MVEKMNELNLPENPINAYITKDRIVYWSHGNKYEIIGDIKEDIEELRDIMSHIIGIPRSWRNIMIEKYVKDKDKQDEIKYGNLNFRNTQNYKWFDDHTYTDENGLIFWTNGNYHVMIGGNRDKRYSR